MPGPRRRQHEVTLVHGTTLRVDRRHGAAARHHEADRLHAVPVRPRSFAWQQGLQTGTQIGGGSDGAAKRRVGQQQHAPLCIVHGHLTRSARDQRLHVGPGPEHGLVARSRLACGDALVAVPQGLRVANSQVGNQAAVSVSRS